MKVTAYLMSPRSITVLPDGEPAPKSYMAVVEADTGIGGDDWRLAVRLATEKMNATYRALSATTVARIEEHKCKTPTMMVKTKRYDLNGKRHLCPGQEVKSEGTLL